MLQKKGVFRLSVPFVCSHFTIIKYNKLPLRSVQKHFTSKGLQASVSNEISAVRVLKLWIPRGKQQDHNGGACINETMV